MSVRNENPSISYRAAQNQIEFAIPFDYKARSGESIQVKVNDKLASSSAYNVVGLPEAAQIKASYIIRFLVGHYPATNDKITISRSTQVDQQVDYVEGFDFSDKDTIESLDKLTRIIQEIKTGDAVIINTEGEGLSRAQVMAIVEELTGDNLNDVDLEGNTLIFTRENGDTVEVVLPVPKISDLLEDSYDSQNRNSIISPLIGVTLNAGNRVWTSGKVKPTVLTQSIRFEQEWKIRVLFCCVAEGVRAAAVARVEAIFSHSVLGDTQRPPITVHLGNLNFPLQEGDDWPSEIIGEEQANKAGVNPLHLDTAQIRITWISGADISFDRVSSDALAATAFLFKMSPNIPSSIGSGLTDEQKRKLGRIKALNDDGSLPSCTEEDFNNRRYVIYNGDLRIANRIITVQARDTSATFTDIKDDNLPDNIFPDGGQWRGIRSTLPPPSILAGFNDNDVIYVTRDHNFYRFDDTQVLGDPLGFIPFSFPIYQGFADTEALALSKVTGNGQIIFISSQNKLKITSNYVRGTAAQYGYIWSLSHSIDDLKSGKGLDDKAIEKRKLSQPLQDKINEIGITILSDGTLGVKKDERAFLDDGVGIEVEDDTEEIEILVNDYITLALTENFSIAATYKTIYSRKANIGRLDKDNGDFDGIEIRFDSVLGNLIKILFSAEAWAEIYDSSTATKLKAPYSVLKIYNVVYSYRSNLNAEKSYRFIESEMALELRTRSRSGVGFIWRAGQFADARLQLENSDGSVKRYNRVRFFGGATLRTGANAPVPSDSNEIKIYDIGSLGKAQGDSNGYITGLYTRAIRAPGKIPVFFRELSFEFSVAGWAAVYDSTQTSGLKAPWVTIKYNGFALTKGLNRNLGYEYGVSARRIVITLGPFGGYNLIYAIPAKTQLNLSIDNADGSNKLFGFRNVKRLTNAEFNEKVSFNPEGVERLKNLFNIPPPYVPPPEGRKPPANIEDELELQVDDITHEGIAAEFIMGGRGTLGVEYDLLRKVGSKKNDDNDDIILLDQQITSSTPPAAAKHADTIIVGFSDAGWNKINDNGNLKSPYTRVELNGVGYAKAANNLSLLDLSAGQFQLDPALKRMRLQRQVGVNPITPVTAGERFILLISNADKTQTLFVGTEVVKRSLSRSQARLWLLDRSFIGVIPASFPRTLIGNYTIIWHGVDVALLTGAANLQVIVQGQIVHTEAFLSNSTKRLFPFEISTAERNNINKNFPRGATHLEVQIRVLDAKNQVIYRSPVYTWMVQA